jgi:hypothetical protein
VLCGLQGSAVHSRESGALVWNHGAKGSTAGRVSRIAVVC